MVLLIGKVRPYKHGGSIIQQHPQWRWPMMVQTLQVADPETTLDIALVILVPVFFVEFTFAV